MGKAAGGTSFFNTKNMISDYFSDTEHDINDSFQCGIFDIKSFRFFYTTLSPVITWYGDAKQDKGEKNG